MIFLPKISSQRIGRENIERLIAFAFSIVMGIGVLSLMSYFYNENRKNAVITSIVFSKSSTITDFEKVGLIEIGQSDDVIIQYDGLSGVYSVTFSGLGAMNSADDFAKKIHNIALDIDISNSPVILYKAK